MYLVVRSNFRPVAGRLVVEERRGCRTVLKRIAVERKPNSVFIDSRVIVWWNLVEWVSHGRQLFGQPVLGFANRPWGIAITTHTQPV